MGVMKRANHPLSTALFEATSDEVPDSKALLMLNEAIADGLMLIAQAVGQACCDADIGAPDLQPLLAALPALPTFEPIMGAHLAEVLLPIIRDVAGNEEQKAQLLAQPHVARLEVGSMVKAIQDLYGFTHFMNSPIATLAQTLSPRLLRQPNAPQTTPEAMEVYEVAREMANLLWNIDENANSALALETSELAATFYQLFLAQDEDPGLRPQIDTTFGSLSAAMRQAADIIGTKQSLKDLLHPSNPLHNVTLALLDSSADFSTTAALLALESMDDKQRRALCQVYGQEMDKRLRGLAGQVSDLDRQAFANMFKLFSMGTLSLTPPGMALDLRSRLAELGAILMSLLSDPVLDDAKRREKCAQIRNALRPLLALLDDSPMSDLIRRFLDGATDLNDPRTYAIQFTLRAPDLSLQIATLKKLMATLKQFVPKEV